MKGRAQERLRRFFGVGFAALVLLGACQQATVDPDQALRSTIVGAAWAPDSAYASVDVVTPLVVFYTGGTALIDQHAGSWSYKDSVFTIIGPLGTYTTTKPTFSATQFWFTYGPTTTSPQLVHLSR